MRTATLLQTLLIVIALSACQKRKDHPAQPAAPLVEQEEPVTGEQVRNDAGEALRTTGKFVSQESQEVAARLKKEMEELRPKVEALKERTGEAAEDVKESVNKAAQDLNINSETAKARLEELKNASADGLQKLKGRVEEVKDDAKRADEEVPPEQR